MGTHWEQMLAFKPALALMFKGFGRYYVLGGEFESLRPHHLLELPPVCRLHLG